VSGGAVVLLPVDGIGEVVDGDDLASLVVEALRDQPLRDGDVLVVTSKVVSKAEGRVRYGGDDGGGGGGKDAAVAADTDRVVATRGATRIVRTRHGLVLAGAGVDTSNVEAGSVLSLPVDPDASAVRLRAALLRRAGANVAVVVTDTAGRAWRQGQTDIAIGAAGLDVVDDHAGRTDGYGNALAVTAPAVADEIAAAADLVKGKLTRRPVAILRGLAPRVLPAGSHGPGARALVRPEATDMFGLGARDAVLAAVDADPAALRGMGAPAPADLVAARLGALAGTNVEIVPDGVHVPLPHDDPRALGRLEARLAVAAYSFGWVVRSAGSAFVDFAPSAAPAAADG
jgi:coenzyme F420-0:L-glutamate ligase/coenzyme F420-1:gamma-L-glutamate ligase